MARHAKHADQQPLLSIRLKTPVTQRNDACLSVFACIHIYILYATCEPPSCWRSMIDAPRSKRMGAMGRRRRLIPLRAPHPCACAGMRLLHLGGACERVHLATCLPGDAHQCSNAFPTHIEAQQGTWSGPPPSEALCPMGCTGWCTALCAEHICNTNNNYWAAP